LNPRRQTFVEFCAAITGYSATTLEGTALVDHNQGLLESVIGEAIAGQFYALAAPIVRLDNSSEREELIRTSILPSAIMWGIASNLISLWYLGVWNQLSAGWYEAAGLPLPGPTDPGRSHVPSPSSYVEQLSYRTAGAHTPGAKPGGFGSWSIPPVDHAPMKAIK